MFRRLRLPGALIALLGMLFMQLALAAYACPDESSSTVQTSAAQMLSMPMDEAMPGCGELDVEQPGLCHAHAQVGSQSMDRADAPQVQPFVALGFTQTIRTTDLSCLSTNPRLLDDLIARTTAPPLAIRNCCFRI